MSEALQQYLLNLDATLYMALFMAALIVLAWPYRHLVLSRLISDDIQIGLFILAVTLRLIGIGAESLWYDEAFTAHLVGLPVDRMIQATAGDVHPPLHYLITAMITDILGDSEWALRLPAAIFGALAVVLVYRIAEDELHSENTARSAGLIACFLPGLLRYSQEALMYGMLAFWLLLAYWASRNRKWPLYIGALGLALYTHAYAWLYLITLTIPRLSDRRHLLATGAAALFYVPWSIALLTQVQHVSSSFWIPPLTPVRTLEPFFTLLVGYRAPAMLSLALLVVAFAITIAGLWSFYAEKRSESVPLLSFILIPPVLAALASIIRPVYLPRGFIASACLLPLSWSLWLTRSQRPTYAAVATASVIAVGLAFFYSPVAGARDDVRQFVAALGLQPGDSLYHTEIESYITFSYYTPPGVTNWLFTYASDLGQSLTPETKVIMGLHQADYAAARRATPGDMWLVVSETPYTSDVQELQNTFLLQRYHPQHVATLVDSPIRHVAAYRDTGTVYVQ